MVSNQICKIAFCFSEIVEAKDQHPDRDCCGNGQLPPRQTAFPQQAPTEAFDDADHRVEGIQPKHGAGHDFRAISHRRKVQADLHDERQHIPEIPVFHVERRQDGPEAKGQQEYQDGEQRQKYDMPGRHKAVNQHERQEEQQGNQKIHETRHGGAQRDDEPWEINLGDEVLIVHQAVAALGSGIGEKLPGYQPRKHQQRVGIIARYGQFGEITEYQRQDGHGEQRPQHAPKNPDGGLFVAHLDVPPAQHIKQFPVSVEVFPIVGSGKAWRDDYLMFRYVHTVSG